MYILCNKVLGLGWGWDNVTTEVRDESKRSQQWFKGNHRGYWTGGDGYFILKNCQSEKVLTAISPSGFTIKGKIHKLNEEICKFYVSKGHLISKANCQAEDSSKK